MEYAAEVACPCAHCLLCKVEGDGRSLSFLRFTDEESERTTYGERIEYCPGCGEELGLVTPFSARARRRGGRHREAAKQLAGIRDADLLSFDRTSGARSL